MIALEVSSAAGRPPFGGIGGTVRNFANSLLRADPETPYALCYRFSRWRKGHLFRPQAPNARVRVLVDPLNRWIIPRARIFHSLATYLPESPDIPKLVTIHDVNPVRNPQWVTPRWHELRGRKLRDTIGRADVVVTPSRFTAEEVAELFDFPIERTRAIPNGVDSHAFRPLLPDEIAPIRARHGDFVLGVGLHAPRKNLERLVEAVSRLPELRLILVGRPSNGAASLLDTIDQCKMVDRTIHLARVSHAELVGLMNAARVLAVTSLYEGFGLTVLEGMACGVPVVCSNASSLPEAGGDAALYVDAKDPEAIADAINRVVSSPELTEELRTRGIEHARACSWDRSAAVLRALYREVGNV